MVRCIDVAHWFLSQESMTHKKLQKLCYYAQAWNCALYNGTPLFGEDIQAWVHGPVIPALYPYYADYKWNPIPKYEDSLPAFNSDQLEILETVYNTYSEFTGDQLEQLTHSEDPWVEARGDCKPWEISREVISLKSMERYYGNLYEQDQND